MADTASTIMVVEDEEMLLQAITTKISKSGHKSLGFPSGKQALEHLEQAGADLPDAIWLDYYLKDMNGLEFMEHLKANSQWVNIPVIVVSNSASQDKVTHMLALGANKYVLKAEHRLEEIIGMVSSITSEIKGETA